MRIGFVNGSRQSSKNNYVFNILKNIASKYNHEVINFGSYEEKENLSYVQSGIYTAILLNSKAVDFVITGCSSGQGVMIVSNSFPNVICGHIENELDAYMFMQVNAGNAVSIPFLDEINSDFELIFENLFKEEKGNGYPRERKQIQEKHRLQINDLKNKTYREFMSIVTDIDKDLLAGIVRSDGFKDNFYRLSKNEELNDFFRSL